MKKSLIGPLGVGLLLAGAVTAEAQNQQGHGDAAQNWAAIEECAALRGSDARHACMDQVLRGAGLLDVEREAVEQRENFGQSEELRDEAREAARQQALARQVATRPEPLRENADAAAPAGLSAVPPAQIDALVTTITDARLDARGKLRVLTAEGAIWQQVSDERNRRTPEAGTAIEIERASLGSFRCKIGSTSFRCERLN